MRKLILVLALIALAYTNPPKSNYIEYTKHRITGHTTSGLISFFADPLIDRTTTGHNLLFATVYMTRFGEREVVTLGVGGRFIPLK